ncbi:MAG: hypothetical protein IJ206_06620 [Oscillospiraceae bacterium]|nr:hypothetical protein [Oscillospiraceae bacterium]
MKAVVLEIRNGTAAVLREDGIVEKLRRSCEVGQTIELSGSQKRHALVHTLRAAVAALVILGVLGGGWSYQTVLAYSYVSLDVDDTSIEYTLNRRDQVIDVTAQNEASLELAQQLNGEGIRQTDIGDAIRKTIEILSPQEEQTATVAVTSGSDSKAELLRQEVSRDLETSGGLQFEAHTASRKERKAAQEHGMSTGRYQASRQGGAKQEDPAESGFPAAEESENAAPDPRPEKDVPGKEDAAADHKINKQEDLQTEPGETQSGQSQEMPPERQDAPVQQETRPGGMQRGASPQTPSIPESGPVGGEPAIQPNAAPGGGTP